MIGGLRSYIIFTYLKYILINIIIFVGLIWLSQILRILELQQSLTSQIFDIVKTTALVLPSFVGPLMPFLLIIASFFLNFKFNSSNEIIILRQYFSIKDYYKLFSIISLGISFFYFVNKEIFSIKLYEKYKIQELEIRNNLKLGLPTLNEFHIENEVSIFFEKQKENKFYDVKAIIYEDGQFINSGEATIEIDKKNYNIIFQGGERVILNSSEKSKTNFDKFIYSIENNEIELLMYDKEHFNTFELLLKEDKEFYYQGHNRIYQYFLILMILLISSKIFFINATKKNIFKYYSLIFITILLLQVLNSYMIFLLNKNNLSLYFYYLVNVLVLSFISYLILRFNENN